MFAIDHIQLAIPEGGEDAARAFFRDLLEMEEELKPPPLDTRGGVWFRAGAVHLHCGIESPFTPQKKAHPAFLVHDLEGLAETLKAASHEVTWDHSLPNRRRFYSADPFGNRLEFIATGDGFSQRQVPRK